jgi:transposase
MASADALATTRGCRTNPPLFGPFTPRKWTMPQNFPSCDRDQPMLLPPDLRDWLDEDHLAWFVIDAVAELDLEPFYASYRADGHGRAAHDPEMMVTLFAYAYAVGERSSRGIERRCREDVAFRVICAKQTPVHGRARLCPDQGKPSDRPLQTKRKSRRSLGMAPDCGHPQPAEAPPTHSGGRNCISWGPETPSVFRSPRSHRLERGCGAFTQQPPAKASDKMLAWSSGLQLSV